MIKILSMLLLWAFLAPLAQASESEFKPGLIYITKDELVEGKAYKLIMSGYLKLKGEQKAEFRILNIPLNIEMDDFGIDLSFQVLAAGDTNEVTGSFRRLEGKRIGDLFGVYRGQAGNLGLALLGGGLHISKNQNDIQHWGGAASVMIGSFEIMGLNLGVTLKDFYFVMEPRDSDGTIKTIYNGMTPQRVEVTHSLDIRTILDAKFID